ncbi:uncharacterized protein EMH_0036340 [Eimeria mitis]|uniref:Uncharacterized protein n=1 Tax=Eimeria mitis TaxID=44415 RepID=U6JR90_9EIME|nr:uncharacterized protein EMH_0036340 [Eimeria mitis]CDJ27954.1 hypothetical protein, conserved [Eimeria mitis]
MPRGVADHQGKKQFDEFPLRSSRGFSFQLTGELEGDCGKTNAQTRTESALFESCQSSTAAQEAVRERPLATGPQASAQESVDLLLEQRSVKLSESNAFDGQAFYSLSKSENLESVLQSAVSTKLAQHLRYCSGRDSMVWRHSKQGGDVSLHSTENMTATRVGGVRTPICTQKASARYVKPGSQATAFSESTAVQQKQYYVPLEVEAVSDVSRRPRLYDKQVGGKCTNFAHDGSGNRSSSSIPSKGSRNHRNTELRYASELESFPNRNIARSSGPDVPTREFHSDKPRDSSVPDKGGNAPKRPLDSNSTFGSTAEISSSRRSSTGDLSPNILGSRDRSQATHHARGHFGKSRIDTAAPTAFITRPSYMDTTAVGRRLTAQNNMWSAVGSYEPLASLVFHELYRQLSPALQALCMQCLRTTDSPELRALTDIQQAAMKLVADQSVRRSAAAKKRLAEVFKRAGQPKGTLECLEQFLLTRAPILIYFDIVSLTPHLEQGGFIRSHFEIPQTDATYLRKCNEREQALYSGLYEHESVRPEHHPKYGVRATISASQSDGSGVLSFGHEPLVATLNNPWHVLEALGHEALAALAAFAREPTTLKGTDTAALVDCNIHGEVKLGKDVEAIVLPKSAARDKGTFTKLQEIATQYMVPILSMEKCPTAVKDDCWKHTMRHLQHEVLLKKTALGNTYGQI